ncbi:Zn-dependent protease [Lentzea sp. NBRC 105346]|uniref:M48 family metalloprotease n=1 Tax=Lentzea sp. NBRC 105346 TaxID=3032205 RepID=UPI0024A076D0|nr:M48 family metalloprotease [Lentzea sp. NBRC 105346]GLZ32785.1 Zn-dependent protease [Lentzea sp. NBRC 105346]
MRAVLALALLAGYFVVGGLLSVGLLFLAVWVWLRQEDPGGAIWLTIIGLGVGVPMGWSLLRAIYARPEPGGVPLTREAQPELWRHVDELAALAQTRSPDDIRLVAEANAAVWEHRDVRYLRLGLPLLAGLSVGELRSVLAHELGHYGGGHTKASEATFRAKLALEDAQDGLVNGFGFGPVLFAYARLYALVAASVSREHELYADSRSVLAAGRPTAQRALQRIGPLHEAWTDFVGSYVSLADHAERMPPLLAGFRAYLDHPRRVHELRELQEVYADQEPTSVFDSHPPVRERVAAMAGMPGPEVVPDDERPGWTVVNGLDNLAQELLEPRPIADWPEIVELAGPAHVTRQAALLAHAGRVARIGDTLGDVLDALARGELRKLTGGTVDPTVSEADALRAAVDAVSELLGFAIADALVRTGRARLELNWGGVFTLRFADGAVVYPDDLVRPAVADPVLVPQLRAQLREMGMDGL